MIYFNLDLMEKDAQRRLAKSIDASVKTHLAEFAEFCEPKPVLDPFQGWRLVDGMRNAFIHGWGGGGGAGGYQDGGVSSVLWGGL